MIFVENIQTNENFYYLNRLADGVEGCQICIDGGDVSQECRHAAVKKVQRSHSL